MRTDEDGVDARENASLSNDDVLEELVEFFVVANGEGDVPGREALLVVVPCGVARELQDLSDEVLKDGLTVQART